MKKISMAIAAAAMLLSCGHSDDQVLEVKTNQQDSAQTKEITFYFSDMNMRSFTRASLTELNLTDLWIFDYMSNDYKSMVHQDAGDGFGFVSMSMEYGTHTLYFVASRGSSPSVDTDAKTITWGTVRDTFWSTLELSVQPSSDVSQNVNLARVVGRLKIDLIDLIPTGTAKLQVTPTTWYYGLRYDTGAAISNSTAPLSVNIPSSYIGTINLSASFYTLSDTETWQTNATVALLASDESTLGSVTVPSIPIQRNHITNYVGGVLDTSRTLTIESDAEWVEDSPVTW